MATVIYCDHCRKKQKTIDDWELVTFYVQHHNVIVPGLEGSSTKLTLCLDCGKKMLQKFVKILK